MSADTSLLAQRDFRLLFAASTLATLGASISQMALPLTAVELLHAGPREMGLLGAMELLPFALFGLPAGGWIDRSRKRLLAMRFDLLGGGALALVPLAFMLGRLSYPVLYLAAFLVGCCYAIGGSAMQVFVAQLVGRERLLEANARIIGAESAAAVVGPALAALLISALGAPLAVAGNALGFFLSFALLSCIRRDDAPTFHDVHPWWQDVLAGLRFVWQSPMLRALALVGALWIMLFDAFRALYVLFASHSLGLSAAQLGMVNAIAALGAVAGAAAARQMGARQGARQTLVAGYLFIFIGVGILPGALLAGVGNLFTTLLAALAMFILDLGVTLYSVTYLSLRQKITPDAMLGRMTATMRFLTVSAAPLGALSGGFSGEHLGLLPTLLLIGALGVMLALAAARWLPGAQPESVTRSRSTS